MKAYCRAAHRRKTHVLRDKYEKKLYRYWVEEEYKGTFTREEEEQSEEEATETREGAVARGSTTLSSLPGMGLENGREPAPELEESEGEPAATPLTKRKPRRSPKSDDGSDIEDRL